MPNIRQIAKTLRGQRRPWRFLIGLVLYRTGLCRAFKIRHRDFVIPFHRSAHAFSLWADPDSNRDEFAFLRAYLRTGDLVIDVGANVGLLTLSAARAVGPSGHVLSVEANPRTFGLLADNVIANRMANVSARHLALGACEGTIRFEDRTDDDTCNRVLDGEVAGGVGVRMMRLDDLVGESGIPFDAPIALLKIDVEGYERFVIEGAVATLSRTSCVYFEASDKLTAVFGYTASEVLGLLRSLGFSILKPGGAETVARFDGVGAVEYGNFFAVRDVAEFLDRMGDLRDPGGV